MRITRLEADGFKNLCEIALEPDASYNLILGENAQGKTNLLEAIWALTGCRSFRGTHERDYLPFSGDTLRVEAKFQDARRQQSVRLAMAKGSGAPEKNSGATMCPSGAAAVCSPCSTAWCLRRRTCRWWAAGRNGGGRFWICAAPSSPHRCWRWCAGISWFCSSATPF